MRRQKKEGLIRILFFMIAFVSIAILLLILFFLVKAGLPIFDKVSVTEFIFGKYWYPTASPPDFGILPLILGSLFVTLFSGPCRG